MLKAKDYHWNIQSNHLKTMQRSVTKNSIEKLKCNSREYSVNRKSGRKKKKNQMTQIRDKEQNADLNSSMSIMTLIIDTILSLIRQKWSEHPN